MKPHIKEQLLAKAQAKRDRKNRKRLYERIRDQCKDLEGFDILLGLDPGRYGPSYHSTAHVMLGLKHMGITDPSDGKIKWSGEFERRLVEWFSDDPIPDLTEYDQRVHPAFKASIQGTMTGRMSCSEPNNQYLVQPKQRNQEIVQAIRDALTGESDR